MIRWAGCGLLVLLTSASACGQTADAIREISELLDSIKYRPNPFGGAPIPVNIRAAVLKFAQQPNPGRGPDQPPSPSGPRAIRPVYVLPGPPKLDRHGDPLPAGAVARYGTVRLRHGTDIHAMGFTPDGKFLCTISGSEDTIKMWDPVTGKEVARLNSPAGHIGLAKNGSVFLVEDVRVRIWQPSTNTVLDLPDKTLPEGAEVGAMAVHPDSASFAVGIEGKVLLLDARTGKTLRELNLPAPVQNNNNPNIRGFLAPGFAIQPNQPNQQPSSPPVRLMYSPDGRWLVGNGQKTGIWLWDLRTGKRLRTYRSELDFPEYAFSPDVTKIAVTGQRLQLYALDSEEPVDAFKAPENVLHFSPRFSADGKTLFVVQQDATVTPLDANTGEEKEPFAPPEMNLHAPFALAPGGATVAAIDQSSGIRIWEPKTGKGPEIDRLPQLHRPGFSADGKSVTAIDLESKIHTFDAATGAPGKVIELPGEDNGLPTSWDPGTRRAAASIGNGEEIEVQITDIDTGKVISKYALPQNTGFPVVSFASANRDRMALFAQNTVVVLNPTTGKAVRVFNPGVQENGFRGAISPDGRLVAIGTRPLTVWEVATGKKRLTLDAIQNPGEIAFSLDSRHLATWDETGTIVVVDLRTGTVVRRLQSDAENELSNVALSADGKRLALGTQSGRVTVWDVTTGDVLAPFGGHDGFVTGLAFSADGKRLVSTAQDGTALVWEVPDKPVAVGPVEAAVSGFDEAFRLIGSADAAQAQRGLDYLYKNPAEAAKQAGERLPVPAPTPAAKLAQLVEDLGSEEFATREAALKALEKVGGEAGAALKEAAEKSPSAEIRKTAAELLGKIDAPATRADDLRVLRAVEAMENLRAGAGRAQLEKWAAGPAGNRLTTEATAALARMKALSGK